jgi:hypothetical protein
MSLDFDYRLFTYQFVDTPLTRPAKQDTQKNQQEKNGIFLFFQRTAFVVNKQKY